MPNLSNLVSAKDAVVAELAHARQGIDFYNARIAALEDTLAVLESLDSGVPASKPAKKRSTGKTSTSEKTAGRGGKRAAKAQTGSSNQTLPATSKEFWIGLLGSEPKSAKQILEAAVESLGIDPDKGDLKKLSQRQANALHLLVKAGTIADDGSGRDRKYFRPH